MYNVFMSIRKVNLVNGEYYHVYNRGNSKQKIFHDNEDYFRFISLMYACNSVNNFRIFTLAKEERGMSKFIQNLTNTSFFCVSNKDMKMVRHKAIRSNRYNLLPSFKILI